MSEPTIKYQVETETVNEQTQISLRLLLLNYHDRSEMANRLRDLAYWVEEGLVCPFDVPERDLTLRWDAYRKEWTKEG